LKFLGEVQAAAGSVVCGVWQHLLLFESVDLDEAADILHADAVPVHPGGHVHVGLSETLSVRRDFAVEIRFVFLGFFRGVPEVLDTAERLRLQEQEDGVRAKLALLVGIQDWRPQVLPDAELLEQGALQCAVEAILGGDEDDVLP